MHAELSSRIERGLLESDLYIDVRLDHSSLSVWSVSLTTRACTVVPALNLRAVAMVGEELGRGRVQTTIAAYWIKI